MIEQREGPEQAADRLEKEIASFRQRLAPSVVNDAIGAELDKFHQRFVSTGPNGEPIDVTSPDAAGKFEAETRRQYDEQLRKDAAALEADLANSARALDETIAIISQLRDPLLAAANAMVKTTAGTLADAPEVLRETKMLRALFELGRAEARLAGKSLSAVAALYETADDGDVLRFVVEREARAGWPDVALAADPTRDVTGYTALKATIAKAQRARVETQAPQLVEAEKKLSKLARSATVAELFRHLRSGRGIALLPGQKVINIRGNGR